MKPSPFSSIFFMQSAFVMIGTWDKQTWGSKHEYSEDLQPWLLEEHQSSTIHLEHPHLQVPILRTALQSKIDQVLHAIGGTPHSIYDFN